MKIISQKARSLLLALFSVFTITLFSQTTIYSESFTSNYGSWTTASTGSGTGAWTRGSNTSHSSGATGNYIYSQKYSSKYNDYTYITATSPAINLTGYNTITLELKVWYETETSYDGMKIEYSLNNGSSWNDLGSASNWYNSSTVNAFNSSEDGWSGSSSGWLTKSISLTSEDINFNTATQAKFRVLFASDHNITNTGVAFDEIIIKGYNGYCISTGNTSYRTGTRQVIFNTINTSSPTEYNDYSDYTSTSTDVTRNSSYDLTVKVNTDGNYTTYTYAWIDWNQDLDFNDAGESYDLGIAKNINNENTSLSPLSISIPASATLGNTRMRISTKYSSSPSSCEIGFDGEVEDYSINIIAETAISTGTISPTTYCSGASISVPYTITGTFTSGNIFTAQLSSASGSFTSPTSIGTLTSTSSGTISAIIPTTTSTGSGYRIRVISSAPVVTGTDNGNNISITAIPSITSTTSASRCGTGTVTLGATSSSGTINWYTASTGGSSLGTGTSFTTSSISATTTYWVDATNGSCTTASRTAVTATVNTLPTITGTTAGSRCGTGTVTLGATSSSGTINWYANSTGGTSLNTGTSFTTPSISSTTTYWVDATSSSCTTASRTAVIATINSMPSTPTISSISQPSCSVSTGSVVLNNLPAGSWTLTRNDGVVTTGTGTSKTITGLNPGTYSYTVKGEDTYTTCSGSGTGLYAEYFNNKTLTAPATLTRTDASVNFDWGSGSPDTTINSNSFSARWTGQIQPCYTENYTFSTSSDDGIRLWINGVLIINNWTDHGATTNNSTPISLIAGTKYDIVLEFYENSGLAVAKLYWSSASVSKQIISQSQLYTNTTTCTSDTSANITINSQPTTPTITGTTPASRCGTGSLTLGATSSSGDVNWYSTSTGGTPLGTGTSYNTPSISTTTTYWVDASTSSCTTGSRTAVIATINSMPTISSTTPASRCGTGSVTLGATASSGNVNWYTASTGGTSIYTGTSYITPNISTTTTYWVDATNSTCTSTTRTAVVATIKKNYWTGDADCNWNNPANWCAGVPTNGVEPTLNALIPNGLTNYPIISSTDSSGYVKTIELESNTTLTITDNYLLVTENLILNGKIDLEGDAQLLQESGSTLEPTSSGVLEIDQQGTADTYTYNGWSSPVGKSNSTTNNNSYKVTDIFQNVTFLTSGYNGTASPLGIADYWIWKFDNKLSDNYASWQHVRSTGTLLAGEGFTMKGPGTGAISEWQNYVLLGKPNNGNINLTITTGNDYLVGNPYPSAIDANQFILDNGDTIDGPGSTTGTLYFWEHWGGSSHNLKDYQGGYATYSLSGGVPAASMGTSDPNVSTAGTATKTPGRYIPVAQGFFVTAEATGTIKFNNGQRVYQKEDGTNSIFMKTTNSKEEKSTTSTNDDIREKIRLGFQSVNTIRRQLLTTVDTNASIDYDWGYDAPYNDEQIDDMYWLINNDKYTIQGIDAIGDDTILPLGVHTKTKGLNTISIDKTENISSGLEIYLHDKQLNVYHNLNESNYQIYLEAGSYLDRFEITFITEKSLGLEDSIITNTVIDVYFTNDDNTIVIQNPNSKIIKSTEIFNMLGQSIYKVDTNSTQQIISQKTKYISAGAYIIKLKTDAGIISKKVLIE